jgi:hypothetical protein
MSNTPTPWDPQAPEVQRDQRSAYDQLRARCPLAHSAAQHTTVFGHPEVMQVLQDHSTYSSAVSQHPAVPNGYDQPQHTQYRQALDHFFAPERMARFEPTCRALAAVTVQEALALGGALEITQEFALPFAVRVQSAYLGWPTLLQDELLQWLRRSQAATRSGDRAQTAAVAQEFEDLVQRVRQARQDAPPTQDISSELMHTRVDGRLLDLRELASVLRNWTVGEVGTIAASIGILLHWLACHPDWQQRLRADPKLLPTAIDEVLRIDGPLVGNRRITTRPVTLGGCPLPAGERIAINWIAANRDPRVFDQPDEFRLDRDPALNLLYGAGIHVCPGAPLARLELRVLIEEVLARTQAITLSPAHNPTRAVAPDAGYATLHMRLQ